MEVLCRFQDKCKNEKCTFAHLTDLTKALLCKHGDKCNKLSTCKFLHPDDLKIKRKLCQYQDKCPHEECRFIHLDNLYRCDVCNKLMWSTTEVMTDAFMIKLIKDSGCEGHKKNLRCDFHIFNEYNDLLSEQSQSSISDSETDTHFTQKPQSKIDIEKLLPESVSIQQLLSIRTDLNNFIKKKSNQHHIIKNK